jgi:hypothetical protein
MSVIFPLYLQSLSEALPHKPSIFNFFVLSSPPPLPHPPTPSLVPLLVIGVGDELLQRTQFILFKNKW